MGGRLMKGGGWKPRYCSICGKQAALLAGLDPFCPSHPTADVIFTLPPESRLNAKPLAETAESEVVRMS